MSALSVLNRILNHYFGNRFTWQAAGGGQFHHWITVTPPPDRPAAIEAGGLCCFHLPLLAAIDDNQLTPAQAGDLIVDQMISGFNKTLPQQWVPHGMTIVSLQPDSFVYGLARWIFGRCFSFGPTQNTFVIPVGYIVFFSTPQTRFFAHVAIATGQGVGRNSQTVSFGHGANLLGGTPLPVEHRTVDELCNLYGNTFTEVSYGRPPW